MAENSKIEWTDATWNPIRGCSVVSPGCKNCYAMKQAHRFSGKGQAYEGLTQLTSNGPVWTGKVKFVSEHLADPLKWKEPRRIFVNSMSDVFHEGLEDDQIAEVFGIMAAAHWHTFQVLTKRPKRMLEVVGNDRECGFAEQVNGYWYSLLKNWGKGRPGFRWDWPLPNVWLGVSCENQKAADERIPLLLQTPAAVRLVSAEPLLSAIDLTQLPAVYADEQQGGEVCNHPLLRLNSLTGGYWCGPGQFGPDTAKIDWCVAGGESGPGARPMHPDWARSLRDQCKAAGVPFFFKQGSKANWPDFKNFASFPKELQVREYPNAVQR